MSDKAISNSNVSTTPSQSIFESGSCMQGSYCEMFEASGEIREQWQGLANALNRRGKETLTRDYERANRMRHEDGATLNPFDDLTEQTSSWALDTIPLPISSSEWAEVEAGLQQRAHLLEKILADTYGPQELLTGGKIAPELIYANPNFLRSCHGIVPAAGRYLSCYAADVYRDAAGQFRVFRDYGSNPAGLGYALENRIVMSRVFSNLYHKTQIRRLAPFFKAFHQSIIDRSSLSKNDPGIVLFSSGPDSEIYFEHALLSRYLGYPLVEGQDLTVRNGRVYLKKLAGLEPVEAIIRHVNDQESDPFALRRRTTTGVAGLIQVFREQNIDIISPIGAGFIETPALQPFLPQLCRDLLGEELQLSNHMSWWCGNSASLQHVLQNPEGLNLHSAMERSARFERSPEVMSALQARPWEYLASAPFSPSSCPAWDGSGVTNSFSMIRLFACATENGFSVMPGGLAITAQTTDTLLCGKPERQKSKDVWILSDEPVEIVSLMSGMSSIPEFKRTSDLPNRVADNLLWLGRYLERAEGLVRILRSVFRRLSVEDKPEDIPELQFLLHLLQAKQIIPSSIESGNDFEQELSRYLEDALYSKNSSESVLTILRRVQQTAHNVRDRLSIDCFRIINRMEDFRQSTNNDPLELLDETLVSLSAFSGLAMESMHRGLGWSFMDMGRRIERAMNQSVLIRLALPQICHDSHNTLQSLLEICDSLMTYRGRYRSAFQLAPVLDLLLADEVNPKSLAFQIQQISAHVEQLPRQNEKKFSSREECIALELLTRVRLLDITGLQCDKDSSEIDRVVQFLQETEVKLKEFGQQVSAHYLTRVPSTPHYAMYPGGNSI